MFKRIYIELSNYCNLNCVFCTPKDKFNRRLTLDQYIHIFNQAKEYTKEVCLHVLGEPLIHPNIYEILKYTNQSDCKIMISTNGRVLPKMEDIFNYRIDTFNISLHSTYDMNDDKRIQFLYELLEFIKKYQDKYTSVFHLRLWANTNEKIKEANDKIKAFLFKYYNYNSEIFDRIRLKERVILTYENEFEWPNLNNDEYSDGYCLGGKTHIGILANGTVVLCCLDASGNTNLGNIFDQSLKDILNKEKYLNAIKGFKENKCYLQLCKHCRYKRRNT